MRLLAVVLSVKEKGYLEGEAGFIYMDQRCQGSDLSLSAGEGLGEGGEDQLIRELEQRIRHG